MEKETKGKANTVQIQYYQSPCGTLILGSFENKLCMCDWVVSEERRAAIDKRIQKALNAQYAIENSEVITQTISPVKGLRLIFLCFLSGQSFKRVYGMNY